MNVQLREAVRVRARDCCEYCRLPQNSTVLPHEVDHIRALKHGGATTLENLCWACAKCNAYKGSDIVAYPPGGDEFVPLFNPRSNVWEEHFYWEGASLRSQTPIGAATLELLRINEPGRVEHRRLLEQLDSGKST